MIRATDLSPQSLPADVPIGGTTGLCHEHSAAVDEAAAWLATLPSAQRPRPLVPAVRARFGLSAPEVCAVIAESRLIQARAT